jgi:Lanthionine-containing peptide SapB precursor RamS
MALLDLQAMDSAHDGNNARCSGLSVALCDSIASLTLCL